MCADLESQLRKLRQTSANLEEENALLSRHVENMKSAVEKVQKEVQKQEKKNESLQSHLAVIREVLAVTFKDVPLPGSKETPTPATIDSYMSKLQSTISSEPDKHPLLMEKVSAIKHLGMGSGCSQGFRGGEGSRGIHDHMIFMHGFDFIFVHAL